jgi:ABC-type Fe3+ transport system substrate-binding protein
MRCRGGIPGLGLAALIGCLGPVPGAAQEAAARYGADEGTRQMLVRGTTDIEAFAPVLRAFAGTVPGLRITYEQWGSNDLYRRTDTACRGGGGAVADMIVSSAVDQQVKLVNDGCAQAHRSDLTERLPPSANWRDELFGVTREPAVIVYNGELVAAAEAPRTRFDLIDLLRPEGTRFAGKVATYDIEASGLGYLFAFADAQQATTFGSLLEAFGRSGAVATCCSAEILDGVADGRWLIAYNVLGSYALARAARDRRIAVVAPHDYTLILARAAMIPTGAREPAMAGAFIDFMLSGDGQRALAASRLVVSFGEAEGADLDFSDAAESTLRPIPLSPALLVGLDQQKRALFLGRWRASFGAQ